MKLGSPFIRNFTPEDYSAGPLNWAIAQGKHGLMYFANENGVLEYDGIRWRLIETRKQEMVRSLAVDDQGVVYVGGKGEFGYLGNDEIGNLVFRPLSDRLDGKNKKFQDVWSTHVTSHGVYFVTLDKIFRWHRGKLSTIDNNRGNVGFLVDDDVYVFHLEGGVSRLRNGELAPLPQADMFSRKTTGRIVIISHSDDRLLIATEKQGCFIYRLDRMNQGRGLASSVLEAFPTQIDDYLRNNNVYYFATRTEEGTYIFPTIQGGIVFMSSEGKLEKILNEGNGLNSTAVGAVFVDRDHNLWAASTNGISYVEISSPWTKFELSHGAKTSILTIKRHKDILYLGTLNGLYFFPEQQTGLGDDRRHFVQIKNMRNQCHALFSFGDTLLAGSDNEVYAIRGKRATRLMRLNKHRWIYSIGRSRRFPDYVFMGLYSNGIAAIAIERSCKKLARDGQTCAEAGLDANLVPFKPLEIANESIRAILEDDRGDLWLLSEQNGIIQVKFGYGGINDFQIFRYGSEQGLPTLQNRAVEWLDNQLIVANSKGVYRAEELEEPDSSGRTVHFVLHPAIGKYLPAKARNVYSIYKLGEDLIVDAVSGMGILKKNPDGSYTWDDKLFGAIPTARETTRAYHVDPDGTILVSKYGLLYRYDPGAMKKPASEYHALIRRVETGAGHVFFGGAFGKASSFVKGDSSSGSATEQVGSSLSKLGYELNSVAFEFSAAFYEHAFKNLFKYKLEGFDEGWSHWARGARKEYTNLPEGKYTFLVKAKNAYGQESRQASYRLIILPPWYRTRWAYAGYVVTLLLFMFGGMRLYFYRLVKTKGKLEKIVKYRTAELQESLNRIKGQKSSEIEESMDHLKKTQQLLEIASQRAGMAELANSVLHNVGNVLTSVNVSSNILKNKLRETRVSKLQDLVKLLNEHEEDLSDFFSNDSKGRKIPLYLQLLEERLSSEQAAMMDEVARLQASIDHIKTIVGVQQSHASVSGTMERVSLERLVDEALVMSGMSVGNNGIKIVKDIEYLPPVLVEAHSVLQILVNLMNNARHSLRGSKKAEKVLTVNIGKIQPQRVQITISDNGMGIPEENVAKLFTYGFTTKGDGHGFGLHRSANAAKEMNGSLTCHSEGLGNGASFNLELPFQTTAIK